MLLTYSTTALASSGCQTNSQCKKSTAKHFFLLLRHHDEILYLNDMPRKHIYKFQISYFIHFETGIRAYMLVVQALGNSNISYSAK